MQLGEQVEYRPTQSVELTADGFCDNFVETTKDVSARVKKRQFGVDAQFLIFLPSLSTGLLRVGYYMRFGMARFPIRSKPSFVM